MTPRKRMDDIIKLIDSTLAEIEQAAASERSRPPSRPGARNQHTERKAPPGGSTDRGAQR